MNEHVGDRMQVNDVTEEKIYQGLAVSPGIAVGPVHVVARGFSAPDVYSISEEAAEPEKLRFRKALDVTKLQLDEIRHNVEKISGEEEGRIFEAHLMILEDNTLLKRVDAAIEERLQNAEYCFYAVIQNYLEAMRRVHDTYLRERTADIEDVSYRVLENFSATPLRHVSPDHQHILATFDLSPSDTASMDRASVLGFVTERGSVNSHTAILARSLGIPAIVGLESIVINVTTLAPCILDGYSGKFIVHPSAETLEQYEALKRKKLSDRAALDTLRDSEVITLDGRKLTLSSNIEFNDELDQVQSVGAKGVGLYRTEFFLLEGEKMPNEKQQTATYTEAVKRCGSSGVIFRTLDAGGDKLPAEPLSEPEPNPFLGWRGIRVSLSRKEMFKTQLRAILRASAHGKTGLMFPLVSGMEEVLDAKQTLAECMQELRDENIPFDEKIEVGVMIEVPSAVLLADEIAREVDFLSIGTNDLIQYTIAVDRVNDLVANLYQATHPSVIRLIQMAAKAAARNGIWIGVCGEMAGDLTLTPLLIGLGIDELSVGSQKVPQVRKAIRSLKYDDCEALAERALNMTKCADIATLTRNAAIEAYGDLLD